MDPRRSQQTREDAAQSLRQWATARDVPLLQIEQMVTAILSGQHDATILRASMPVQAAQQQQHTFVPQVPAFDFRSMFGNFPMPPMPVPPMIPPPLMNSPPAAFVPNMFPTTGLGSTINAPNVHATRTTFPGGEAFQQNSSYAGQHGSTNFQYSSSSTLMVFTPNPAIPMPAPHFPPLLNHHQRQLPRFPAPPLPQPAPLYEPLPVHPPLLQQPQRHPGLPMLPPEAQDAPVIADDPFSPRPLWHPDVPDREPQNKRLAETLREQFGEGDEGGEVQQASGSGGRGGGELEEATYFADIPGMPDRGVQQ